MTRTELKARIDELSDDEVEALAILLGPSEDEMALASASLQKELADALSGKLRGKPVEQVAREMGLPDV